MDITYPDKSKPQTAGFAGGCFWCTEAVFEELDGVIDVTSGYSGGSADTANYERVCQGDTGHAEAIKITYDPAKITFGQLLMVFFSTHDPTTLNRQGNDVGTQYRSTIFYANDDEKKVAEAYIKQLEEIHAFKKPIVTTLEPLTAFYPAEAYHQNYACQNPHNPYIAHIALPKVQKVRELFKDKLKPTTQPK
jgi:peptide-methionine (S)-S-oxide reductase